MTSRELRKSFLDFFISKQHRIVSSAPVIPHGDPTLLFTNAGMNQFKEVFLGQGNRDYTRAADTQKCIRVSGKHNDLEEVGRDTYHHTFFEMLGNWSFGDYYKKEAIAWAWELLTTVWKFPKNRLWATVYSSDEEAFTLWSKITDIDHSHILRFGEKENFWEMGETGPCGPCSEIHMDLTQAGNADRSMVNAGRSDVIEIWNLVFIQNNRLQDGQLEELPAKHVDTGMGFERACAVVEMMNGDFQHPPSNYDTDVFSPLITAISAIAGITYGKSQSESDVAVRVIADHIRALTFAIADGAIPSNEGRGYVLRRILRRAARFGRTLGMHEPFLYRLVTTLVETMGDVFPEIVTQQKHIERVIKAEEEAFNQTLDRGLEIFESAAHAIQKGGTFPGDIAFRLYDTFGFPFDLTALLCAERGLLIDEVAFKALMEKQRERSREASKSEMADNGGRIRDSIPEIADSVFKGYSELETNSIILYSAGHSVVLDQTPFYAESGGQTGDTGELILDDRIFRVTNTTKDGALIVHTVEKPLGDVNGKSVRARVDQDRRFSIMRNHTATHLLHASLRKILGTHVHQAGSLVAPDHLRFDFAHFAKLSHEELAEIEQMVNERIHEGIDLNPLRSIPFETAQKMGALMFFGDKYGALVNVIQVDDFSKEFCGGTHVANTADIGYFKIRSEASIASGVRRIEAVTHEYAIDLLKQQMISYNERLQHTRNLLDELNHILEEIRTASNGNSTVDQEFLENDVTTLEKLQETPALPTIVEKQLLDAGYAAHEQRLHSLEQFTLQLEEKRKSYTKELLKLRLTSASNHLDQLVETAARIDQMRIVAAQINAADLDSLKAIGDNLRNLLGSGVGVIAATIEEKVSLVCVVTDDLIKSRNLQAGKIVGAVAKILGGGGGGKAHMATAGGRDQSKITEALKSVEQIVRQML